MRVFTATILVLYIVFGFPSPAQALWEVCAIGDSQVEPGSAFIRHLQQELGPEYTVRAEGRRGWTTIRWLNSGDFGAICQDSDIVLISLGGNDIAHRRSWEQVRANVAVLASQIPHGRVRLIYHMMVPRLYIPRPTMGRDGIHLTLRGAKEYSLVVAPYLRLQDHLQP